MGPLATEILNWKPAATAVLPPQKKLLPQPTHNISTTSTSSRRLNGRAQCDAEQSTLLIGPEFPGVHEPFTPIYFPGPSESSFVSS